MGKRQGDEAASGRKLLVSMRPRFCEAIVTCALALAMLVRIVVATCRPQMVAIRKILQLSACRRAPHSILSSVRYRAPRRFAHAITCIVGALAASARGGSSATVEKRRYSDARAPVWCVM
jgi:hypothetical protein